MSETKRKAFRVRPKGWKDCDGIVSAVTRGEARSICAAAARDAGYKVPFTDIQVLREPHLDEWAERQTERRAWTPEYVEA
jgi:hypothetical protein